MTCVILSNFCNFSQLVLSTHPLLLYQFLSSHQTFVIFSPLVFYSLFYVIYAPYKCTCCTHHTNNPLSRLTVRMLSANTLSQLTSCLWPSCHFDLGGSRCGWGGGGYRRKTGYLHFHATRAKIDIAVTLKQNREGPTVPSPHHSCCHY